MIIKLEVPLRMLVVGSSGCGKSTLVAKLISERDKYFEKPFKKIIYCAKYETSVPALIKNDHILNFHAGCPTEEMLDNSEKEQILFILDDLLESCFASDTVSSIFTQGRNRNISVILLSQNLFPPYPKSRNISLNANYIIVFRNLRDSSSISHLARQIFPENSKSFCELFIKNVSSAFSHLVFDFTTTNVDFLRYRENIVSEHPIIYSNDEIISKNAEKYKTSNEISGYTFKL